MRKNGYDIIQWKQTMALNFGVNILPHGTASQKLDQLDMIPALKNL